MEVARATATQFKEAFVTVNVDAAPAQKLPRPAVVDLFVHAAGQIHRAAAEIWPGEPVHLVRHVPSVTGYVHRVCVGDRVLYAKTSFLGVSLVSLLRGTHGPWPDICRAQEEYVRRPDSLIAREAEQLQILDRIGRPRVCALAGLRHGVMFTEPVAGPSLGDLLLKRPCDAWELLAAPFAELRMLPLQEVRDELARRPGRINAGIGRTRCGPAGAVLSTLRLALGIENGTTELSVPHGADDCYGVPLRFEDGRPHPSLPPLDPQEVRQLAAASTKLRAAYVAVRDIPTQPLPSGGR
ncbi:hypothetical protein ACF09H_09795 [Streptomyces sp. NPDC014983]|uniref:hypothetical protein n=1 Tax=Streptomyces sp. NPDC014983 TaxID=3364933 RepID=UPI00370214A2